MSADRGLRDDGLIAQLQGMEHCEIAVPGTVANRDTRATLRSSLRFSTITGWPTLSWA